MKKAINRRWESRTCSYGSGQYETAVTVIPATPQLMWITELNQIRSEQAAGEPGVIHCLVRVQGGDASSDSYCYTS
jgi:hypothetical protein